MNGALEVSFVLRFPAFRLDAAFTAPGEGVTALFGPSGSGKTTVLRCIAGLVRAPQGRLQLGGVCWQDESRALFLPPHRRPLGYVFQESSLFPHLSVRGNLAYGWKRVPAAERRVPFDQAVALLGLGHLLERTPQGLSGGERQRVAIGRAVLAGPRLLLLDEPLANLDRASKAEILPYLERLRAELGLPMLYVSHDLDEVSRLADHLVVLRDGRVTDAGPATRVVSGLGRVLAAEGEPTAVLEATPAGHDARYQLAELSFAGGRLWVSAAVPPAVPRVRVRVHARDVSLALYPPQDVSILNVLPVTVREAQPDAGGQVLVRLDAGGTELLALITRKSHEALRIAPGLHCHALIKGVAILH
ncbi:MAG TPA: molybdenum ABC transporter ATP-binding protein [bacterium]|nr:molybdenum ABC transporter ATP-binding protein [bacterium]